MVSTVLSIGGGLKAAIGSLPILVWLQVSTVLSIGGGLKELSNWVFSSALEVSTVLSIDGGLKVPMASSEILQGNSFQPSYP